MSFLKSSSIFPFAYGPENPFSRSAEDISESRIKLCFDMTSDPKPECAAVAVLFDENHPAPSRIKFSFDYQEQLASKRVRLMVELKNGSNKFKYMEKPVCGNEIEFKNILPDTTEIVFVCWGVNVNKKSEIIVSAEF